MSLLIDGLMRLYSYSAYQSMEVLVGLCQDPDLMVQKVEHLLDPVLQGVGLWILYNNILFCNRRGCLFRLLCIGDILVSGYLYAGNKMNYFGRLFNWFSRTSSYAPQSSLDFHFRENTLPRKTQCHSRWGI